MTIQWWKVRRELARIRQQLQAIPEAFTDPIRRRRHDRNRQTLLRETSGDQPAVEKLAIFLVYQPAGLSESTYLACEHLIGKGYATLLVSNAPLRPEDLSRLKACTWRVIERPNFGYDFGGYRDGLWVLNKYALKPAAVLLLNDSIWFPLTSDESFLNAMEDSKASFVGALKLGESRGSVSNRRTKQPFFGSFFLLIKRPALEHPAFAAFWATYRMTSNKYETIRRGERGLSYAINAAGIDSEAIFSRDTLDRFINNLDEESLRDALSRMVVVDSALRARINDCLNTHTPAPDWMSTARNLAMQATEKQNILATAPALCIKFLGVPFLKKGSDPGNLLALRSVQQFWNTGWLSQPHASILDEVSSRLSKDRS